MNLRRIIIRTVLGAVALVVVLTVALVIAAVLGISINAAPWRGPIAAKASAVLGRQVTLEGPLRLTVGLRPELTIGGIAIANPPGFSEPQFATLGRAHMLVDLWPLLRDEISVLAVEAEDVKVRLEQAADGRVNWNFALPASAPGSDTPSAPMKPVRLEQVDRFTLKHIEAQLASGGTTRRFALDELEGRGSRGQPISIRIKGRVEQSFPYTVNLTGGSLAALYERDKPWPLQLGLEFAGTAINVSGTVTNPASAPDVDVVFGLGTQDLSELERLLQAHFPAVGATGLSGHVKWKDGQLDVADLRGAMGQSTLEGHLGIDLRGTKPKLNGELRMPLLDMRPFMGAPDADKKPPPKPQDGDAVADLRRSYSEIERKTYDLKQVGDYEGDLLLRVDRWLGVVGEVRDSELRIGLHDGKLTAPVKTTVADVALAGELDIDALKPTPEFSLWLGTEKSPLGRLAQVFASLPGVQGELGRFRLALQGHGKNLHEVVQAFTFDFEILKARLSYGNVEGGKPVDVRLDAFKMTIPAGGKLNGTMTGSLVGTPFRAQFKGGDLPTLTRETRWPLEMEAAATGAVFRLQGVLAAPEATTGTDVSFELSARRAGDVARWLGLSPQATAPVSISAHARIESDEWRLDRVNARLGDTVMHAEVARTGIGKQPLVQAKLVVDHLDVPQLEAMLPPPEAKPAQTTKSGSAIDLPILPQGIDLFDSDVDVQVKKVQPRRSAITDVSFNGHIREGKMWPSPFSVKVSKTAFSGAVAVDLRGKIPEASLWIAASSVNLGELLKELGAVESLEASTELVRLEVIGRGSRLGEMLQRSSLLAEIEQGALTVRGPNNKLVIPIRLNKGSAHAPPGEPVHLDLDGAIDKVPVAIRIASGALPDFMQAPRVPFSLTVDTSGTHVELAGSAALPITQQEAQLELTARGARFDSLNELARVQLPPWGPWELKGKFRAEKSGYAIPDLRVQIGASTLIGHGSLDTAGVRPDLKLDLTAPQIQLNDFALAGFTFTEKKSKAEKPMSVEEMRAKAKEAAAEGQKLLSREFMRKMDADIRVEVAKVLSGRDELGNGMLAAKLSDGRFALDPMQVNVPGGSLRVALGYEPTDTDLHLTTNIAAERFDYGILARRLKPEANIQGLFSLRMDLDARSPTLDTIMHHANGRIDFSVWPRDLDAGIFDLWAVNLFLALLPTLDPGSKSTVNCVVGRFNVRGGKLSRDALLMDTSRMRVLGDGEVDFASERMHFRFAPRAKEPQFFSLSTPVAVDGTLSDFHIGVSGGDLFGTAVRFFTSWIVVPFEKLGGRAMPRDGADVCGNPIREAKQ
jgi:uncharacterized protein involved in outer membrane biogenesis